MPRSAPLSVVACVLLCISSLLGAQNKNKNKNNDKSTSENPLPADQPSSESIDLNMYQQIRDEGFHHPHIMEYASALFDGIGPRLTGSPNMKRANEWTLAQLTAMGCSNAHLEDWGEFGMGWQQRNTWIRMVSPDTAIFIAQATPWSPATNGPITASAVAVNVKEEKDFDQYKGKLAGKIVLLGEAHIPKPVTAPLFTRYEDKELTDIFRYAWTDDDLGPQHVLPLDAMEEAFNKQIGLREKIAKFLADEKALAVIVPGYASGGTLNDDTGSSLGWFVYLRDHASPLPVGTIALENFGRVSRLLTAKVSVTIEMNVDTVFTGDHEHGFDTIAELPGADPRLKEQLVMVGGHLDSWIAGTGATDDGAGAITAMEVMRILAALHVQPRRTIRVALWSGEEQGLFGSGGYVKAHFGSFPRSSTPEQLKVPEFIRKPAGPLALKPEHKLISAYYNIDNGGGKIRGIYAQENNAIVPIFEQWIAPLKDLDVTTVSARLTGSTDHMPFDEVGIPGFQFIQDPLDYETRSAHTNMDVYERLIPGDLEQAAVVEAIFVYNTAMRERMMPRKPLPHPELYEQQRKPLSNVMPGATPETKEDDKGKDNTDKK
ncbi:MAG TPA: M20/M25/M40 family metallo-hydrolase [Terriglobales bacterium]|nr:M20/M25/M40 family metallo-hydrolase [Terriglobales bacterium]